MKVRDGVREPGGPTVDVLAVGAHPDDVELGCGGTLATLAAAGRRTGILHLTSGESGTRGTPDLRREEARRAAKILGVAVVEFLDCGDGGLRTGPAEEDAVIAVLRRLRPELVLGPTPADRHPDHGRAHRLVRDACFYAGLARRGSGAAHRPGLVASYMQHDPYSPDFIVPVPAAAWERKLAALDAYSSQIHRGGTAASGAVAAPATATKVSSPEFRAAMEGRGRHFGNVVGAEFGEPFVTALPLRIEDPATLVAPGPAGLR